MRMQCSVCCDKVLTKKNENTNMEDTIEIDLQELFGLLLHWLWLIVLCGLVTGVAGFLISKFKFVYTLNCQ